MDQFLRKNLWVINLLSLAALAFFLATGMGSLISLVFVSAPEEDGLGGAVARTPRRAKAKTRRFTERTGEDICRNNVFNFKVRPCAEDLVVDFDEDGDEEEDSSGSVPPYCSGDGSLIATMASTDEAWSFAMIKSEGKTMPYRSGDEVPGLGKIEKIGWRLVLVNASSGPNCLLDLYPPSKTGAEPSARASGLSPASSPAASPAARRSSRVPPELQKQIDEGIETVSATERNIDRGLVDSLIENSSALMSQARILPYERDGVTEGFKLYGIRRNSLLGNLGLRNGDIVHSIGGIEMTSPDQALMAYTKLRNVGHIAVEFTRRGRRQSMDYNIR